MMKRCILAVVALTTLTWAQSDMTGPVRQASADWPARWTQYDVNLNGKLEDGEWRTLQEVRYEGDLTLRREFDLDQDGQVEQDELNQARLDYERWAYRSRSDFDANRDGRLDDLETMRWASSQPR